MGFMNVGTIEYKGDTRTVWTHADPNLAAQSWEMQKAQYFPDYTGPPPTGLPISKQPTNPNGAENKKPDLFA